MNNNFDNQNNERCKHEFKCPSKVLIAIGPTGPTGPAGGPTGATGATHTLKSESIEKVL